LRVNEAVVKLSDYAEDELLQHDDRKNIDPKDINAGTGLFQEWMALHLNVMLKQSADSQTMVEVSS